MNRALRWVLIGVGVIAGLLVMAVGVVWFRSNAEINRTHAVAVGDVRFPAPDSAMLERGRHLVEAIGLCRDCHGDDLAGEWVIDVPAFARLHASNITPAGAVAEYTDADWVRLLRHGVKPDGRSAVVMPSESYRFLSDTDLAAMVQYLRSIPAVEGPSEGFQAGPIGRVLIAAGPLRPVFVAGRVATDTMPMPTVTTPDTSAAYGYYVAQTAGCMGCHGASLSGGPIPGDPEAAPAANITPGGIGSWVFTTFERSMREGISVDGSPVGTGMPLRSAMTDTELRALWNYLRSLPARAFGS